MRRTSPRSRRAMPALAAACLLAACGRSVEQNDGSGGAGGFTSGSVATAGTQSGGSQSSGTEAGGTESTGIASAVATGAGGGSSTGATTSTGTGTMTCAGYGDACTDCMSGGCADVWCGCVNEPQCLPVLQCWNACAPSDQACIQSCVDQHQAGVSAALLVSNCAASACDGSCNWGQAVPPCTQCIYADCSTAMNACFADAECIPLLDCLNACPPSSLTCQQQCYQAHGAGVDPLQAVVDCADMACANVCNN